MGDFNLSDDDAEFRLIVEALDAQIGGNTTVTIYEPHVQKPSESLKMKSSRMKSQRRRRRRSAPFRQVGESAMGPSNRKVIIADGVASEDERKCSQKLGGNLLPSVTDPHLEILLPPTLPIQHQQPPPPPSPPSAPPPLPGPTFGADLRRQRLAAFRQVGGPAMGLLNRKVIVEDGVASEDERKCSHTLGGNLLPSVADHHLDIPLPPTLPIQRQQPPPPPPSPSLPSPPPGPTFKSDLQAGIGSGATVFINNYYNQNYYK